MLSIQEISSSIYGAWRLARVDREGMNWFNHSIAGFWHSFFVAVLVAPLLAPVLVFRFIGSTDEFDVGHTIASELISYGLGWIVFPIVALLVCRLMNLTEDYVSYIIAYNWSHIIPAALILPIVLSAILGLVPSDLVDFALLAVTFAVFGYRWFIARVALSADGLTAAALVVLEVIIDLLLYGGVKKFL
jgi:hypothetical protein